MWQVSSVQVFTQLWGDAPRCILLRSIIGSAQKTLIYCIDQSFLSVSRFQTDLTSVFRERISIRKEGLELERQERLLSHRILRKELSLSRQVTLLTDPVVLGKVSED